jgi:tripartite ATP-independent transporter DctM subunit
MGDTVFQLVVQRTYSVMANDVLVSIPLFVFMGYIIERANILDRLFHSIQLAIGGLPGSLAIATLATCAIFATATGIVGAVVTLMGLLAFPAMLRAGYDVRLSAGVVCAGGCLGILIPPSVMLILYGATAGVSVPKLYAGALFPGLLLAGLYMVYVLVVCMLKPELAPKLPADQRARLGFDWDKDKSFLIRYLIIAALLVPVTFVGVLGMEWLANVLRAAVTPAGQRLVVIDYEVPAGVFWTLGAGAAAGLVMLLLLLLGLLMLLGLLLLLGLLMLLGLLLLLGLMMLLGLLGLLPVFDNVICYFV